MLFHRGCAIIVALVAVFAARTSAALITLENLPMGDLLGATPRAIGSAMVTTMDGSPGIKANVYSQAYTDDNGHYLYLYQILNTGTSGSIVEKYTVGQFAGASPSTRMGTLTGSLPDGFVPDTLLDPARPPVTGATTKPPADPLVSFDFGLSADAEISFGQHSSVLWVKSDLAPGILTGNVIDGSIASGSVVGPVLTAVPEPAALGLLSLGALVMLRRRARA